MRQETYNPYNVVTSTQTMKKIEDYKSALISGAEKPGHHLNALLQNVEIEKMSHEAFLQLLLETKIPCIFAEYQIHGAAVDWNNQELSILGDIGFAVPVTIYDDMNWGSPNPNKKHRGDCELLYIPGPLLRANGFQDGEKAFPDYREVTTRDAIDFEKYFRLISRRILPLLIYANEHSGNDGAIVSLAGIGCGQFAGEFSGQLEEHLDAALSRILLENADRLPKIRGVYLNLHTSANKASDTSKQQSNRIAHIVYRVGDQNGPTQLSNDISDFLGLTEQGLKLFKVVAWDHVSYPGNDHLKGSRATDDGVASAATDSAYKITGYVGEYKNEQYRPKDVDTWQELIEQRRIKLQVRPANLRVYEVRNDMELSGTSEFVRSLPTTNQQTSMQSSTALKNISFYAISASVICVGAYILNLMLQYKSNDERSR